MADPVVGTTITAVNRAGARGAVRVGTKPPQQGSHAASSNRDTVSYLVALDKFARPTLSIPGGLEFEWPLGMEGYRLDGSALLAIHKYFDDANVVLEVLHRDESRIVLTGEFPGRTGAQNADALEMVCRAPQPSGGKILFLPGLFRNSQQLVAVESWSMERAEQAIDDSFNYSITCVRVGTGAKVTTPVTPAQGSSNTSKGTAKGSGSAFVVAKGNMRTLRQIAASVYSDASRWKELVKLNQKALDNLDIPSHLLPTKLLPAGMKIYYR